ncbi:hypothetical protein EVG80_15355 [Salmonella enterica subsp. enterica serovar Mississippi]|nr:hypothetical protein [Salmonella enterica subsp. enterica serovar Mississippi]
MALKRRLDELVPCEKCGFLSTSSVIKSHHNEHCRNRAIVAKELATEKLTYFRWMHHTVKYGFKQDSIKQVLEGNRVSTQGHTFREATICEIAASAPLTHDGFPDKKQRGVAVWRISLDGEREHFISLSNAAEATPGASTQKISEVVQGERKTHAGYYWVRYEKPRDCGADMLVGDIPEVMAEAANHSDKAATDNVQKCPHPVSVEDINTYPVDPKEHTCD